MKFTCERYPSLVVVGNDKVVAQFENGELETDDSEVIETLKKVPEIKQVSTGRKGKEAK